MRTERMPWIVFFAVCAAILAIVLLWANFGAHFFGNSLERAGQFGDTFGVLNALFSGLAFASLIHAVLLQRTELKLQREELKQTRIELKRQAEAQEKSEAALRAETEAGLRAFLRARIEPNFITGWQLVISNEGKTSARNVRLSLDGRLRIYCREEKEGVTDLSKIPVFSGTPFMLPPGSRMVYLIAPQPGGEMGEATFTINAKYQSHSDSEIAEDYHLDSAVMYGTYFGRPSQDGEQVIASIKEVANAISSSVRDIANGQRELAREIASMRRL